METELPQDKIDEISDVLERLLDKVVGEVVKASKQKADPKLVLTIVAAKFYKAYVEEWGKLEAQKQP